MSRTLRRGSLFNSSPPDVDEAYIKKMNKVLQARCLEYSTQHEISACAITWNVNGRNFNDPKNKEFNFLDDFSSLFQLDNQPLADLYFITLQEIVDLNVMNVVLNSSTSEDAAQIWSQAITSTLNSLSNNEIEYTLLCKRHIVGLLSLVFSRKSIASNVSDIRSNYIYTGASGLTGNKGGIGIRFELMDSSFCFVSAHFHANRESVQARNNDYNMIMENLVFNPNPNLTLSNSAIYSSQSETTTVVTSATGTTTTTTTASTFFSSTTPQPPTSKRGSIIEQDNNIPKFISENRIRRSGAVLNVYNHENIFWAGDLNYRLNSSLDLTNDEVFQILSDKPTDKTYEQEIEEERVKSLKRREKNNSKIPLPPSSIISSSPPLSFDSFALKHSNMISTESSSEQNKTDLEGNLNKSLTISTSDTRNDSIGSNNDTDNSEDDESDDHSEDYLNSYKYLIKYDQLLGEKKKGFIFKNFKEKKILFKPSYKYIPYTNNYNNISKKIRLPGWCDRILYLSRYKLVKCLHYNKNNSLMISDHKPVYAWFSVKIREENYDEYKKIKNNLLLKQDYFSNLVIPKIVLNKLELNFTINSYDTLLYDKVSIKNLTVYNNPSAESNDFINKLSWCFIVKNDDNTLCKPWIHIKNKEGILGVDEEFEIEVMIISSEIIKLEKERRRASIVKDFIPSASTSSSASSPPVPPRPSNLTGSSQKSNTPPPLPPKPSHLSRISSTSYSSSVLKNYYDDILILHVENGNDYFISVNIVFEDSLFQQDIAEFANKQEKLTHEFDEFDDEK